MDKNALIDRINSTITLNGAGAITGGTLNQIMLDILNVIPDSQFTFPVTSDLQQSDVGKLVMNDNGYAVVTTETGGSKGQTGQWQLIPAGGAVAYVSPSTASPRQIYVPINSGINPKIGDTFTLYLANGVPVVFTFTYSPTAATDVLIVDVTTTTGTSSTTTTDNLVSAINANPSVASQGISAVNNFPSIYITDYSPDLGLGLNVSYSPSDYIEGVKVEQAGSQDSSGSGIYNYLYDTLMVVKFIYADANGDLQEIFASLQYAQVFDPNAPAGSLTEGFNYPDNADDYATNLLWALNNITVYSSTGATYAFTDLFTLGRQGDTITIAQNFLTVGVNISASFNTLAPVNFSTITAPAPASKAFVHQPVLGVLKALDNNLAIIDNGDVIKVILGKKLRFQVSDGSNSSYNANIFYRLVKPVGDGLVAPIFPDSNNDNMVDALGVNYTDTNPSLFDPNASKFSNVSKSGIAEAGVNTADSAARNSLAESVQGSLKAGSADATSRTSALVSITSRTVQENLKESSVDTASRTTALASSASRTVQESLDAGSTALTSKPTILSATSSPDYNDLLRVNSTIFYEALQEGNPGDAIYVRRFSFLVPNHATFPADESRYHGYYGSYNNSYYNSNYNTYNYSSVASQAKQAAAAPK